VTRSSNTIGFYDTLIKLATTHNTLDSICDYLVKFHDALRHYQLAIRYIDEIGDSYSAAQFRRNVAFNFMEAGRVSDALDYVRAAQEKFDARGPSGAKEVQEARNLISELEKTLRSK
jgi:hypothetical protein